MFKNSGFDSIIGARVIINGDVSIPTGTQMIIDGHVQKFTSIDVTPPVDDKKTNKTKLTINGSVVGEQGAVVVENITISGMVKVNFIRAEGVLTLKSGCQLIANKVFYRDLVMEPGAEIVATLKHLDCISEGEMV